MEARNGSSFPAGGRFCFRAMLLFRGHSRSRAWIALVGPCWSWGSSHVVFHCTEPTLNIPSSQKAVAFALVEL
eukprot:4718782-Prymnesium_polylepis.1